MRDLFLLDPGVTFLNHGSFGAVPRPVFRIYQQCQRQLELQPVRFLARDLPAALRHVRQVLGGRLQTASENLLLLPNATYGVNFAANSWQLKPGDEILTTNHEYGASLNILSEVARKSGARLVKQPISYPAATPDSIVEQLWSAVSSRTRILFVSHITSPTAFQFPVSRLCKRARNAGIISFVDGAHAPGQIPLDLQDIGADFYTGNCHKWMLSPRGAAFLYISPAMQKSIMPLIISWGWENGKPSDPEVSLLENLQWTGTMDPSALLSIPAALEFQDVHKWEEVRASCRTTLADFLAHFSSAVQMPAAYSTGSSPFTQMAIAPLPAVQDGEALQTALRRDYSIEVPCIQWEDRHFLRISFQAYNTGKELEYLLSSLLKLLPDFRVPRGRNNGKSAVEDV